MAGQVRETVDSLKGIFRSTKDAYDGASRFARLRMGVLAVFAVDVLAVLVFVLGSGGRPLDLEVWFQPGFPSNMLVVRNEGSRPLEDVKLLLDGRYGLEVLSLPVGLQGFEVNRDFRDADNLAPEEDYRPQTLRVETDGDSATFDVESRGEE